MTSGGPGDHPLSDVIHYGLEVYGEEADKLLSRTAITQPALFIIEFEQK